MTCRPLRKAGLPGPLHLGGFSFAGYVAFEAARHLATLGVPVGTLWLFDSEILRKVPGFRPWSAPLAETRRVLGFVRRNWRVLLGGAPDPDVLHVYGDVPMYLREHPAGCRDIIRGLYPAMIAYQPQPWTGTGHPGRTVVIVDDSDDLDAEGSASHGTQARTKTKKYEHLTILAHTRQGLVNLI